MKRIRQPVDLRWMRCAYPPYICYISLLQHPHKGVRTINEHLKNLFEEQEFTPEATIRKFRIVRREACCNAYRGIKRHHG